MEPKRLRASSMPPRLLVNVISGRRRNADEAGGPGSPPHAGRRDGEPSQFRNGTKTAPRVLHASAAPCERDQWTPPHCRRGRRTWEVCPTLLDVTQNRRSSGTEPKQLRASSVPPRLLVNVIGERRRDERIVS